MTVTPFDPSGPLETGVTLLEASAGTGKTYAITHLILRLVAELGVPLDRILAVTFTTAATAELNARVRRRLSEALAALESGAGPADKELLALAEADADELARRVQRLRVATQTFDRAHISTIHSFCQHALTRLGLEAGVDFGAALLEDEGQVVTDIARDFWVARLHDAPRGALRALAESGVSVGSLASLGRLVLRYPQAARTPTASSDGLPDSEPLDRALAALRLEWSEGGEEALARVAAAIATKQIHGGSYKPAFLDGARGAMGRLLADRKPAPKDADNVDRLTASTLRAKTNNNKTTPQHPVFEAVEAYLAAKAAFDRDARAYGLSFKHAFATFCVESFERRSRTEGWRSYGQLIHHVEQALRRPGAGPRFAEALGAEFDAVLVDEFQDTDAAQWAVFRTCFATSEHRLFLVGDPKQAIYRFRGADVATYLEAARSADRRFTLATNWRSDGSLVEALNSVFVGDDFFDTPGIDYPPALAHHDDTRLETTYPPRLRVRLVPADEQNSNAKGVIWAGWLNSNLPWLVAADICAVLASGDRIVEDGGDGDRGGDSAGRPVGPGDMAVLTRTNAQARAVLAALQQRGVPAVARSPQSVFETQEAEDLERVLTALLDASRAPLVRGALVTPLIGLRASDLAAMDSDSGQWEAWARRVHDWQSLWAEQSFVRMFRSLSAVAVDELMRRPGGPARAINLLHLGELLHQAEADQGLKPNALLAWFHTHREAPDGNAEAQQVRLERATDAVEVVTVHKSKGLEYPFVWCPFLWDGVPRQSDPDVVFHDTTQGGRVTLDLDWARARMSTAAREAVREARQEQMRLVYVAMTRAVHRCTVFWGRFYRYSESPLFRAFHRKGGNGQPSEEEIWSDLEALGPAVGLEVENGSPGPDYAGQPTSTVAVEARRWTRSTVLDEWWRRTSFSGLVRNAVYDEAAMQPAADEDGADADSGGYRAAQTERLRLAELPGGRKTGNFLHAVFEHADFQGGGEPDLASVVAEQRAVYGFPADTDPAVTAALEEVFQTPIVDGLRLSDIAWNSRFNELEFLLPVAGGTGRAGGQLTTATLAAAFSGRLSQRVPTDYPAALRALRFLPARGYLTGSIDLVFRAPDGRWWVVDYKSNRLGSRVADYAAARLGPVMAEHHYVLQYHLYSLALHRYLGTRLPGYQHGRHFGGVAYLFLRGMAPAHPAGTGVFVDRPSEELLEAIGAALEATP